MDCLGAEHLSEISESVKLCNKRNIDKKNPAISIANEETNNNDHYIRKIFSNKYAASNNFRNSCGVDTINNIGTTVEKEKREQHNHQQQQQQQQQRPQENSILHKGKNLTDKSANNFASDNSWQGKYSSNIMTSTFVPFKTAAAAATVTAHADTTPTSADTNNSSAIEIVYEKKKQITVSSSPSDLVGGGGGRGGVAVAATLSDAECDCDSLLSSDGKEKADATPENLKKIDDVIELSNKNRTEGAGANQKQVKCGAGSRVGGQQQPTMTNTSTQGLNRDSNRTTSTKLESISITGDDDANGDGDSSTATTEKTSVASAFAKQSLAFTIDNFSDKDCDPAAAAAKYKNMLERFQNRHRRGASMSKLEVAVAQTPTTHHSTEATTLVRPTRSAGNNAEGFASSSAKVKMRARDRSTSRVRDSSKRHSWSPRSSMNESVQQQQQQQQQQQRQRSPPAGDNRKPPANVKSQKPIKSATKQQQSDSKRIIFMPRSTAMQIALQKVDFLCPQPPLGDFQHLDLIGDDNISEAGTYTLDGDNYTEEQKDLMNIDRNNMPSAGGTQRPTDLAIPSRNLNHVECNKTSMSPTSTSVSSAASASHRHQCQTHRQNVLEVSYYHESESEIATNRMRNVSHKSPTPPPHPLSQQQQHQQHQQQQHQQQQQQQQQQLTSAFYLEKIRSRVLRNMSVAAGKDMIQDNKIENITAKPPVAVNKNRKETKSKVRPSADDIGTFTSVTTSGVLAKQCTLDSNPKLTRRSSLSTSQIDSSEYVSNEAKLKTCGAMFSVGGFTDHQKAEYRLNLFTNQKDQTNQLSGDGGGGGGGGDGDGADTDNMLNSPLESPTLYKSNGNSNDCSPVDHDHDDADDMVAKLSDTAILKTAPTKNDWIQEWALNARARSVADDKKQKKTRRSLDIMSRSYNCSNDNDNYLTDDINHQSFSQQSSARATTEQQQQQQQRHHKTIVDRLRLTGDFDYSSDPAISLAHTRKSTGESNSSSRPPKSPSKIPSPMHSIGRTRSASRTRSSLQNMLSNGAANDNDYDDDDYGPNRETDLYLQKTAAAISNLQQNLSRKNSIKSPPQQPPQHVSSHGGSPKKHYRHHQYYSADECSPQHSIDVITNYQTHQQQHQQQQLQQQQQQQQQQQWASQRNIHKRNLSMETYRGNHLMTNSYNEQQLMMMMTAATEVTAKGNISSRPRKNSFDGEMQLLNTSPARQLNARGLVNSYIDQTITTRQSSSTKQQKSSLSQQQQQQQQQQQSPLRRSSSFSVKSAAAKASPFTSSSSRSQYQNLQTPPAARHSYESASSASGHHQQQRGQSSSNHTLTIKKSASSTTFRNVYSDYDDNVAYYINDEDDLNNEYYSTEDEDDENGVNNCHYDKENAYDDGDEDDLIDYSYDDDRNDNDDNNCDNDFGNNDENNLVVIRNSKASRTVGGGTATATVFAPLSNARYNKALLMRIERSKQKVASGTGQTTKLSSTTATAATTCAGLIACPNTPELPRRRIVKNLAIPRASTARTRQSMPRDTSLNRMGDQIPNSLASAKKQILQTANNINSNAMAAKRVQPKYLDISKYKPQQSNNFLRKNDTKSTLKTVLPTNNDSSSSSVRRSPSNTTIVLNRSDLARASNRSARSAASMPVSFGGNGGTITGTRAGATSSSSAYTSAAAAAAAARRDTSVSKQKEVELAMWKRRATYDPMRAAAEDRRKKEEAKRLAQGGGGGGGAAAAAAAAATNGSTVVAESNSSVVARSQSFNCDVGSLNATISQEQQSSLETNRWTLTSTESSDEEDCGAFMSSGTNRS